MNDEREALNRRMRRNSYHGNDERDAKTNQIVFAPLAHQYLKMEETASQKPFGQNSISIDPDGLSSPKKEES